MHKHDPRPPKHASDLGAQAVDDPLDARTMPHATRSAAPDKARAAPKLHGRTHTPILADRHARTGAGHGRRNVPATEKKGGSRSWLGPEREGEREAIDELEPLEEEEGPGGGGPGAGGGDEPDPSTALAGTEGEGGADDDKALTLDEYEARLGRPV